MTEPVRLAKRVAQLKACSRREAEQYIEGGWVRVDGVVVELPQARVQDQHISIDPQANLMALVPVTLLLHKPAGYDAGTHEPTDVNSNSSAPSSASAMHSRGSEELRVKGVGKGVRPALTLITPQTLASGDRSGIRPLLKHFAQQTLGPPLESAASGLVVYSQDWRVARKLSDDAAIMEQEFTVEVAGTVDADVLEHLNRGLHDGGRPLPAVKVSLSSTQAEMSRLRFAVKGAHPGLIAYLCDRVGLRILAMKRIRIGRVPMTSLPLGQWRYLLGHERF